MNKLNPLQLKDFQKLFTDFLRSDEPLDDSALLDNRVLIDGIEQFQNFIENPYNIIIIIDKDLTIKYESPSLERITGFKAEDRIGKSALELIHPEDLPEIKNSISQLVHGRINEVKAKTQIMHKDGNWRYVEGVARSLFDKSIFAGLIINLYDITGQKLAEFSLAESKERLDLALRSTGLGIWDQNFKTGEIFRNEHWTEMLGYKPDDIGRDMQAWKELIHPDDLPIVEKKAEDHEAGLTDSFEVEHRLRAKNGEWKWILNWGKIIERDRDGKPIRALGTHFDITQRKRIEDALKESEEKYRNMVEMAPDGIATVSLTGFMTTCNSAFLKLTGFSREELVNKHISQLPTLRLKDIPKYLKLFKSTITGEVPRPFEFEWVHKNGEVRVGEARLGLIKRKNKITGIQFIASDITDRKRIEIRSEAKIQLMDKIRAVKDISDCLKLGCQTICNAKLFRHVVCLLSDKNSKVTNIEYVGLKEKELMIIKRSMPSYANEIRDKLEKKFRISNSFYIPQEAWPDSAIENTFTDNNNEVDKRQSPGDDDDKIIVPLEGEIIGCEGWLIVSAPFYGCKFDKVIVTYLEDIAGVIAKKVNEIQFVHRLKEDKQMLENKNVALREIMANVEREKIEIKQEIANKIDQFITPIINRIENKDGTVNRAYIELLNKSINELVFPSNDSTQLYQKLSPREVEICDLIKNGLASKEIAEILHLSLSTIQKHRERIRNKLGLANKNINLTTFLKNPHKQKNKHAL